MRASEGTVLALCVAFQKGVELESRMRLEAGAMAMALKKPSMAQQGMGWELCETVSNLARLALGDSSPAPWSDCAASLRNLISGEPPC